MAALLLLVAAVPFSQELEQSARYRQRLADILQEAVLATVVEDCDAYHRALMRHGQSLLPGRLWTRDL